MKSLFRFFPLLLLLLAGCAVTPPAVPPSGDESVDEAMRAFYEGQYDTAIDRFSQLRDKATPPKRQEYEIYIAEALHKTERSQQAQQMLESMPLTGLTPYLLMRRQLLRGDIVLRKDPELALSILQKPAAPVSERAMHADFYRLRATAYSRLEKPLNSAQEFVAREPFLANAAEREANQLAIWQALGALTRDALEQTRRQPPPDTLSGWIELAAMAKNAALPPDAMSQRLEQWRRSYPGHPVTQKFLDDLLARSRELAQRPTVIGLLLPLTGQFAQAGAAIRDGILAAYYQSPGHQAIRLNIYDAGAIPDQVLSQYELAVTEGAQFVIGPLDKGAVQILATQDRLPVPVLALNYAGPAMNDNIFQFSLAPEEEASAAAERAWADGHTRMAMISSDDALGARMTEAFAARWNELGGTIAGKALYEPQQMDHTTQLEDLLKLADSNARRQRLQQVLGKKVEFTPRRRQDLHALFIAAPPIQGRLLRPQLKFNFAGDLPVYATSSIYGGRPDANQDRDLDGVMFCDMPWTFDSAGPQQAPRHALKAHLPHYGGQLQRLVAMGVDAYHLVPMLRMLQSYPYERLAGETGTLRVGSDKRLLRELKWARFKNGLAQPIESLTE
ncbi:MAG TPA: penicillin-binding protein activator [Gammaproteobacteria bacterium]